MRQRIAPFCLIGFTVLSSWASACAQAPASSGYFTDPATGNVYRPVHRTIERPLSQIQNQTRERTIYRPQVVAEMRRHQRTIYSPTVEYGWKPEWQNWWNPFAQPTVAYRYVPQTRWQARSETFEIPHTETRWVAEKQIENIPTRVTQLNRESVTEYELVHGGPAAAIADATVVARLQAYQPPPGTSASSFAASTSRLPSASRLPATQANGAVGIASLAPADRSPMQTGMRPSVLAPNGSTLPGANANIATAPPVSWWR